MLYFCIVSIDIFIFYILFLKIYNIIYLTIFYIRYLGFKIKNIFI